jgi:hypothetical protein
MKNPFVNLLVFIASLLLAAGCARHAPIGRGGTATAPSFTTGSGSSDLSSDPSRTYRATITGPHSRVWQRVTWTTNAANGSVRARTNSYTELEIGMAHLVGDQWVDSSEEITITPTGAHAANAQHQVVFLGNINSPGAVDVATPEGKHLTSSILGLS